MQNTKNYLLFFMAIILLVTPVSAHAVSDATSTASDAKISFQDVGDKHPHKTSIEFMVKHHLMKGYDDNTFQPDRPITRVEALKVILQSAKAEIDSEATGASDVFSDISKDSWYTPYITYAKEHKIIKGKAGGLFHPDGQVTLAEFLKVMLQTHAVDLSAHENLAENPFKDVPKGEWYAKYVHYVGITNILEPDNAYKVHPNTIINRGQAAELLFRFIAIKFGDPELKLINMARAKLRTTIHHIIDDELDKSFADIDSAHGLNLQAQAISKEKSKDHAESKSITSTFKLIEAYKHLANAIQAYKENDTTKMSSSAQKAIDTARLAIKMDVHSIKPAQMVANLSQQVINSLDDK